MNEFYGQTELIDIFFGCQNATELLIAREELEYLGQYIGPFALWVYSLRMNTFLNESLI